MPLSFAELGQSRIIRKIGGSPEITKHLEDLGFHVGGKISVVNTIGPVFGGAHNRFTADHPITGTFFQKHLTKKSECVIFSSIVEQLFNYRTEKSIICGGMPSRAYLEYSVPTKEDLK